MKVGSFEAVGEMFDHHWGLRRRCQNARMDVRPSGVFIEKWRNTLLGVSYVLNMHDRNSLLNGSGYQFFNNIENGVGVVQGESPSRKVVILKVNNQKCWLTQLTAPRYVMEARFPEFQNL